MKYGWRKPIYIKNTNVQTVRRDIRNRNDPDIEHTDSKLHHDDHYHSDGMIDDDSIVDSGSDGGGTLDDNEVAVSDDAGYYEEDDAHVERLEQAKLKEEKKTDEQNAQYYVDHS